MAVSFGSCIPSLVTLRVSRAGDHAIVRVFVGREGAAALTGRLTMTRDDWRRFRALLPQHDPQRLAIHYADGEVFDWLTAREAVH